MNDPSFSIVVPTFERRQAVLETVQSLDRLDYPAPFDIIVIVDGSSDGTASTLKAMDLRQPLQVIEQPNRGLAAARNRGAAHATGDILLFLDDDMTCPPDLLRQHARSYRLGADAVAGSFSEPPQSGGSPAMYGLPSVPDAVTRNPFGVFGGHFSVRRSAFEAVGGFDDSFTADGRYGYEDTDLAHRLLERFQLRRNGQAITHHRTSVAPRTLVRRARASAAAEQRLLAKHPNLAGQLEDWSGTDRISRRLRLLSHLPILPQVAASAAAALAQVAMLTPLRTTPVIGRMCSLAYTIAYWSAVRQGRGVPRK